ncbi:MAG: DUF3971 domain-containing protein [Rhodopila sp.]|nr:DUF3971 domain-containing protein [Rhodopila sp.]
MIRSAGTAIHHTSKAVHRLLVLGTGMLVVVSCLLAVAAWRLAQGPIDLGWLSDRLRAALIDNTAPISVSFDGLALAWEGFQKGVDHPLDLRVSDITVTDPTGHRLVVAPRAHLTFSLAGLLLGRIVPRTIEVDHAQIAVTREADGPINFGLDLADDNPSNTGLIDLRQLREQLSRPISTDHGRSQGLLDQIQRAHFRDTEATIQDRRSGFVVRTSGLDLDFVRARGGRLRGTLQAPLSLGDQQAALTAAMNFVPGSESSLDVKLTSFRPANIGALPHAVAFMADLDVPMSFTAKGIFDAALKPLQMRAAIQLGQGQIQIGNGTVPLRSGTIELSGTSDEITITKGHLDVAHTPDGNPEIIDISGTVAHVSDRLTASLTVGIDQIDIGDLPRLWPIGVGGGARPWVTEHVTSGLVTHGTASFVIESDDALRDVMVTKASGDLDGSNATFTWIDNIPPVEQTDVHLHLVDPDTLDILISSAHQRIRNGGADLLIKDGQMRITGLSFHDQVAVIHTLVEGPVASALALLKEPRLHLLSAHPIALKTGGGDASATLDFRFPLENKLQIEDVQIHADAHLQRVRLLDVAGGQGLDDGSVDLSIDKDGLSLKGRGSLAAIPVTLDGRMDFSQGPASQVVQKIVVTGQPDATQLDAAGLHVTDVVGGSIPMTAVMIERRSGDGSIAITGDLTLATLGVAPLAWHKPSGDAANAAATLVMSHDRLTKIDRIAVRGDGLLMSGSANFIDGHFRTLLLDAIQLGRTQGHGTIHLTPNKSVAVVLQGDQIDLSPKLTEKVPDGDTVEAAHATTPNWTLDARFDHAILANGERARDFLVTATGDGDTVRLLDAVGSTRAGARFSIKIGPEDGKRHLRVDATDAGAFLRGMDTVRAMQAGHLMIDAAFDSPVGYHPLLGTAVIDDVVVRNSPVLGKLLQAITLYGLVDVLRGPGMTFSHIVVPFRYDGVDLNLDQAQAYNPSLGLTAKGWIALSSGQTAISGTIVPAYFFNSMLGQLPLVGKLFSPEKGGGLFAARFGLKGQIDDPSISINPVSALTPGFLRGIFGIFDDPVTGAGSGSAKPP